MKRLISAYDLFEKRVDDIDSFIQKMMSNSEILRSFEKLDLSSEQQEYFKYLQSVRGNTIQYNAIIISLYGRFENYIDTVFSHYLDFLFQEVKEYEKLPSKIQEKYSAKLGEYLLNPNRFYGIDISIKKLLDDYLKVLNSDFSETVSKSFLLMHSGNMRMDQINVFMNEMGIQNSHIKIYKNELMKSFS